MLFCLLLAAGCSADGGPHGSEVDVAPDVAGVDVAADAAVRADLSADAKGPLEDAPDSVDVETTVEPPPCPDPDPMGCLPLEYEGLTVDPTEYPAPSEFHGLLDEVLAGAATDNPLFSLTREEVPFYDFQPEDSPFGRLEWEYAVRHGYFEIPSYLEVFRSELEQRQDSVPALLSFLSDKTDSYLEHGSVQIFLERADELASKPGALEASLKALWEYGGEELNPGPYFLNDIPGAAHEDLARLFFSLYAGLLLQRAAFEAAVAEIPLSPELYEQAAFSRTFDDLAAADGLDAFGAKVDFRQLYRGAEVVHRALSRFEESPPSWDLEGKVKFLTPLGFVALGGTGPETFQATSPGHLLVLDLGGNDKYMGVLGATRFGVPLSVILDLGGDDVYENDDEPLPSFAAGHLGYAVMVDVEGDDTYLSNYNSLASACLGVAILDDRAGNDSYSSVNFSQAAAMLGVALLRDGAGEDKYYSFRASQSYASYRGASLLLDVDGNDSYVAEAEINIYPSAQNSKYNANMSQGAGQGYRNDAAGLPNSYSGGVALLADLQGDDIYSAGLFAQGVGYWFGVGFHLDVAGNDEYDGIWYNFGASAHFAGGVHGDWEGDDTYFCLQDQCLGEGRDYSIGFMLNGSGKDSYWGKADRNIGAGDLYGTGIFWDQEGEDSYRTDGKTGVGQAYCDTENENSITVGIFLDSGGTQDEYLNELGDSADSSLWTQVGNWNDGQWLNVMAVGSDN